MDCSSEIKRSHLRAENSQYKRPKRELAQSIILIGRLVAHRLRQTKLRAVVAAGSACTIISPSLYRRNAWPGLVYHRGNGLTVRSRQIRNRNEGAHKGEIECNQQPAQERRGVLAIA